METRRGIDLLLLLVWLIKSSHSALHRGIPTGKVCPPIGFEVYHPRFPNITMATSLRPSASKRSVGQGSLGTGCWALGPVRTGWLELAGGRSVA